jgi:hypothetical protein
MYIVTRYLDSALTTYTVDNWNHVGCLIATGKIVSFVNVATGVTRSF